MKEVPQLDPKTRISYDYWNEYFARTLILTREGFEAVINSFEKKPVKKYTERFSNTKYISVTNEINYDKIERLDQLAELVNEIMLNSKVKSETRFKKIVNEVYQIIKNQGHLYQE